ncbi:hypothetical protein M2132_000278 [Dysgonomonas sp. PH5-45]|uniref:hypothetical protein n=1 Tax=unclassified Dysgonomonas TaxID=2630389 RepID=UPI002474C4A8|nr:MULTISPECIES: hypothetical protein [unclassified Dysgonomonas]MDH6353958.1 hypothetical protein [Dysgonomonas sp. PH5-45]MDH6386860.1 hypothetical protein [Dysgonomonas sp. PH5-37]
MPDKELRKELWRKMLPPTWLGNKRERFDKLIDIASESELSGGAISNVIRRCGIQILSSDSNHLSEEVLKQAIKKTEQVLSGISS